MTEITQREKTEYVIGIYFTYDYKKVALILKNRPKWQEGLYNFPGGHIEEGEIAEQAIIREFKEECCIDIPQWELLGEMDSPRYRVVMFTAVQLSWSEEDKLKQGEDQPVIWAEVDNLPDNIISNLRWLIPLAVNFWKAGNCDDIDCVTINY